MGAMGSNGVSSSAQTVTDGKSSSVTGLVMTWEVVMSGLSLQSATAELNRRTVREKPTVITKSCGRTYFQLSI